MPIHGKIQRFSTIQDAIISKGISHSFIGFPPIWGYLAAENFARHFSRNCR